MIRRIGRAKDVHCIHSGTALDQDLPHNTVSAKEERKNGRQWQSGTPSQNQVLSLKAGVRMEIRYTSDLGL